MLILTLAVLSLQVDVKLAPSGIAAVRGYVPHRLTLAPTKPEGITKEPKLLGKAVYGVLELGPKDKPQKFAILIDEAPNEDWRLYVDANGNGDLTDDGKAAEWKKRMDKSQDGKEYATYLGWASIKVAGFAEPIRFGMYRFDPTDPRRAQLASVLLYYCDYGYKGKATLSGKPYDVTVVDDTATANFMGDKSADAKSSGIQLLIDVNGNGKIDPRGESYDAAKPFNIGGTTYEIKGMTSAGTGWSFEKSNQTVAEILPPPDLTNGKGAIPFSATTVEGKSLSFPGDYKGKIVMLDFWATWCGPCKGELPGLVKAYETYHSKGFEIVGISLDQENQTDNLKKFLVDWKMPWPQIYDGKFWQAELAQLYVVNSIPAAFLIDGDTGKVIASGGSLRGELLDLTLKKALKL